MTYLKVCFETAVEKDNPGISGKDTFLESVNDFFCLEMGNWRIWWAQQTQWYAVQLHDIQTCYQWKQRKQSTVAVDQQRNELNTQYLYFWKLFYKERNKEIAYIQMQS